MEDVVEDEDLLGDVMHGLGEVANIAGGDAGHGDATILSKNFLLRKGFTEEDICKGINVSIKYYLGEVDRVVGDNLGHLVLSHPSEAEHADLRSEVVKKLTTQEGFVDDHCDCYDGGDSDGDDDSNDDGPDLVGDVLPVVAAALLGQAVLQSRPHPDDPVGHHLHVTQPLRPGKGDGGGGREQGQGEETIRQTDLSSGLVRTSAAILAPWRGGLE